MLNWGQPIGEDWNVSSVNNTGIQVPKKENWNVFDVVCLRTSKAHYKLMGEGKVFSIAGGLCPN